MRWLWLQNQTPLQLGLGHVGGVSQLMPILLGLQTGAPWRLWEHHSSGDLGLYQKGRQGPKRGWALSKATQKAGG